MIKECPNCKFTGNIPGARFCSNCGAPLINSDNSYMEFVEYTRLMRGNKLVPGMLLEIFMRDLPGLKKTERMDLWTLQGMWLSLVSGKLPKISLKD